MYQDYNEWPVPGFKPNSIEKVIRCVRYLFAVTVQQQASHVMFS
jgi:hypothetical protein